MTDAVDECCVIGAFSFVVVSPDRSQNMSPTSLRSSLTPLSTCHAS